MTPFQTNFEREGGDGLYPPPRLHALLICYLIYNQNNPTVKEKKSGTSGVETTGLNTAADLVQKHRLIQYLFLDLASSLTRREEEQERHSGK